MSSAGIGFPSLSIARAPHDGHTIVVAMTGFLTGRPVLSYTPYPRSSVTSSLATTNEREESLPTDGPALSDSPAGRSQIPLQVGAHFAWFRPMMYHSGPIGFLHSAFPFFPLALERSSRRDRKSCQPSNVLTRARGMVSLISRAHFLMRWSGHRTAARYDDLHFIW